MSIAVIKPSNILSAEHHAARLNYPLIKMQQLNMAPAIQPSSIPTVHQSIINNCTEPEVDCVDDSLHEDESQLTPDSPKSGILPHFEYVSYDRVQDLYEQRKGHFYFIPDGFEPVLVPNDSKASAVTNLLENSKPVSSAPNVSRMLPDSDVRLPSFALPCGVAGSKKDNSANGKNDASTRRVSAPGLPHNLLADNKTSGSRRIPSGFNDSDGYLSDSQLMAMQNQQSFRTNGDFENHMFYASPTNTSQQETFGFIDNSMPHQFSYVQNTYDNCPTDFASFDVEFDEYDYNGQITSLDYPITDQYSQY
ncbi:6072_t:CDS:2, partial [Cetraspora pellucida]